MSTDHNFWRERRAEADSNRSPSAYQPNALPLGQTGSQDPAGVCFCFRLTRCHSRLKAVGTASEVWTLWSWEYNDDILYSWPFFSFLSAFFPLFLFLMDWQGRGETDRQTDRHRQTDRQRQRKTERDRERQRHWDRQTDGQRKLSCPMSISWNECFFRLFEFRFTKKAAMQP